ncbi:hypothetical protein MuYL_1509 [Mucilaginibacter xinganensis]|uniref:Uncharacterized protein n=1 Tax=Mucilaginibacter xinganensis TaxID=1234841 RepID=A0A223NU65_9SPHI|nr:hypothetical protein MuYL_1509 [Mucilaginibacter xinganensis]
MDLAIKITSFNCKIFLLSVFARFYKGLPGVGKTRDWGFLGETPSVDAIILRQII